jgi:hypothetical protein
MKRPLLIAIGGLLLCLAVWLLLHGGAQSIAHAITHAYENTDFAQHRGREKFLRLTARDFETKHLAPPQDKPMEFHIDFNDWGHPLQYGWENGIAVLRSAGRDRKLYTSDDIMVRVQLTNQTDRGSVNSTEHTQ